MGFINSLRNLFAKRESTYLKTSPRRGGVSSVLASVGGGVQNLAISTVFRCVRLLSESVANLPLKYMRLKNGVYVEDTTDRLHYLLTVQPNPNVSAVDFWAQVVLDTLLYGNAYIVPVRSLMTGGDVERLVLCKRGTVSHDTINDTYTVSDTEQGVCGTFGEDSIIHIKNISLDGKTGLSTLSFAALTTSIANTADRETLSRFANGGNVRGFVSNDTSVRGFGEYQDDELANAAEDLDDLLYNQGKRIVSVPGQVKFNQFSLSSVDMQFLESRKFTVREICRFFGVHPSFVFDDTNNNYKSAEMANVAFLSNTLNPILRKIENELHRKLIASSLCHRRKFEFDRESLYACDLDSKVRYQTQTLAAGLYTVNEWRAKGNMPPVEGGDTPMVTANLRTIAEISEAKNEHQQEPQQEPDEDQELKTDMDNEQ